MKSFLNSFAVFTVVLYIANLTIVTCSSEIAAKPPRIKMRQDWTTQVESKQTPTRLACNKLTNILPSVNWSRISVNLFEATLSNQKTDVFSQIVYSPSTTSEEFKTQVFYSQNRKTLGKEIDQDKEGWVYLLENKNVPVAILKSRPAIRDYESQMQKAGLILTPKVEPQNSLLSYAISQTLPKDTLLRYFGLEHDADHVMFLHDVVTGKEIVRYPPTPRDWDELAGRELDQVDTGSEIIFAGTEYTPQNGSSFVWFETGKSQDSAWKKFQAKYDEKYLNALLPKFFQPFKMRVSDFSLRPQVDKNSNIVFRFVSELETQSETMVLQGLVLQPRQGKPKLLTWAAYHSLPDGQAATINSKNLRDASRAFDHVWFPNEKGEVVSEFRKTDSNNDFFFDIDNANNAVIYLLGGRLWSIDLPDTSTPAKP